MAKKTRRSGGGGFRMPGNLKQLGMFGVTTLVVLAIARALEVDTWLDEKIAGFRKK